MRPKDLPSAEYLRECIEYFPETGELVWKERPRYHFVSTRGMRTWNNKWPGKPACGHVSPRGYRCGSLDARSVFAHRIAWKIYHGREADRIDHINGVKTDNRIVNLRSVSVSENAKNKRPTKQGKVFGVYARGKKWSASIGCGKKLIYLGIFSSKEEAIAARRSAERLLKFHPNHGRSCDDLDS